MMVENISIQHKVKYDDKGHTEAISWIFLECREALVLYGGVLFLDTMKRDYNEPGWPYIGPCVKYNENEVRVTAEGICISDNYEMYNWIICSMVEIEP